MKFRNALILAISCQLIFPLNFLLADGKVDSLEQLLRTTENDTVKAHIYNNLFWELQVSDSLKALAYLQEALQISEKNNLTGERSNALVNYGNYYDSRGDFEQAIKYYHEALEVNVAATDTPRIIQVFANLGYMYSLRSDYPNALKNFIKGLEYSEKSNYRPSLPGLLNNIGELFRLQKNASAAEEHFLKAVKICEETNNKKVLAHTYNNLGILNYEQTDNEKALGYFFKSLKIKEERGDKQGMTSSMNNIGEIYMELGKYKSALDIQLQAIELNKETGDMQGLAYSFVNIGKTYLAQKNKTTAIDYFLKGARLAEEQGIIETLSDAYHELSECFELTGDFKSALLYHKYYRGIKDSLFNEGSSKQMAEMQGKYESEKKQKEIDLLQKDKLLKETEIAQKEAEVRKQNTQKIALGSGFFLVILLALVLYRGYKNKQKANVLLSLQKNEISEKNYHLESANVEIRKQKEEIEEKNSEILSSIRYALRIQEAILPTKKLVRSYLENSFILYKPKDIVAGDFFWMAPLPNKETGTGDAVLFAVCDCTGHGVPGAFVSIVAHNALNRAVKEFGLSKPSDILDKVNELVVETFSNSENEMQDGMDIALCSLESGAGSSADSGDKNFNKLHFSGANNSIYLVRNNLLTEIKANKQPIGKFADRIPFTNHTIELNQNDAIYAFSDGFADQFGGPKGKKFKYSQFENLLCSIQDKNMEEQRELLNDNIENWKKGFEQLDDICILGVRV